MVALFHDKILIWKVPILHHTEINECKHSQVAVWLKSLELQDFDWLKNKFYLLSYTITCVSYDANTHKPPHFFPYVWFKRSKTHDLLWYVDTYVCFRNAGSCDPMHIAFPYRHGSEFVWFSKFSCLSKQQTFSSSTFIIISILVQVLWMNAQKIISHTKTHFRFQALCRK